MPDITKVLVIEDSEDDRFLYRRVLCTDTAKTYEIIEHDNGEDGINSIASTPPDCILLDYSLPGRNGIEVLKRIRSKYPHIPVVMLTGQGNEAIAVTAMREGAQDYVSKAAITPEILQRSLRVAIEHCALAHHIQEQRASLEMFTRALAHDLKEPVRTIRSFLELMMHQDLSPDKTQKYFAYIVHAAERMSALIDTVYFYMRLDNAAQQIAKESCDANQALENAKENLDALIRERKAVITAEPLPTVQANKMQLIQVLQNLISNAIQHCETIPVIHITAEAIGNDWLFRVADNGPGIPQEYQDKIFEPFKRLTKHREDGLGLGLAICKKIVEAADGKIGCESTPPRGTTFFFTFAKAEAAVLSKPIIVPTHIGKGGEWAEPANILIVEDNEADIELTRFALIDKQKLNCRLLVTRNGHEALARLKDQSGPDGVIDLVLLDINMPGMDGFELLTQMRAAQKLSNIPVVMCTTSTYDKDIEQARSLGAAGYMIKPLDFNKFRPVLEGIPGLDLHRDKDGYALTRVH